MVVNNNFWLLFHIKLSEDERSKRAVGGSAAVKPSWVGMEEGAEECACQFDPRQTKGWVGWGEDDLNPT